MGRDQSESDSDLSSCHKTSDYEDCLSTWKKSKYHECSFEGCGKTFNRPSKLEAHKRLHEGQRPFVCSFNGCDKAYTNSSHLKRHVKVSHGNSESVNLFRCPEDECEAVLRTRQCLKKHIKRKHTDLPYKCPECKAKFKRNHKLKEHTFIHTGVHPFICDKCNKGFEKSDHLKKHQRCHRTYTCQLKNCSVTFPSMSLYRKHLATVHKPDYKCAVCYDKFTTLSNLKSHCLTHMDLPKTLKCPHENCESAFNQERYLQQHLENVHGTSHQYKCPVEDCQKVFKWKRSLFYHVKLHSIKKSRIIKMTRKERKDKHKPKKSMAAELANVTLQPHIHKELISKNEETFIESGDEIILEDICESNDEQIDDSVSKSEQNRVSFGTDIFYRVENVSIEVVSDFTASENSIDCDEIDIPKVINETSNQSSIDKKLTSDVCSLTSYIECNSKPGTES